MHIPLSEWQARLPLPATPLWPHGVWDIEAMTHGTMSAVLFTPRGKDYQTTHAQDEIYVVVKGSGTILIEEQSHSFVAGDVLFVAAGAMHRFTEFTDDLVTWAIFWGHATVFEANYQR